MSDKLVSQALNCTHISQHFDVLVACGQCIRAALDEARQEDRAEIERLRAEVESWKHCYALLEDERAKQHQRAEAAIHVRERLAAEAKLVEALEQIRDITPAVAQEQVHVVRIKRIAEAALAAAKASEEKP